MPQVRGFRGRAEHEDRRLRELWIKRALLLLLVFIVATAYFIGQHRPI